MLQLAAGYPGISHIWHSTTAQSIAQAHVSCNWGHPARHQAAEGYCTSAGMSKREDPVLGRMMSNRPPVPGFCVASSTMSRPNMGRLDLQNPSDAQLHLS